MSYILEIKNVSKNYGKKKALDNVSLNISKGEIIGLVGSNGAGKTTLTEIIAGINPPTSGTIKYNFKYENSFKEKIGMQFQDSTYPSGLTVNDLISFARNLHKIKISNNELKDLLNTFQMGNLYKAKVKSLSGGERQKINILLSIIHNPKIVILDELTTGLDISARQEIIKFAQNLIKEKKITVILISHHMHEIESLASKVFILSQGKLVKEDSIKNIEKQYGTLSKYMIKLINSTQTKTEDIPLKKQKKVSKRKKKGGK